MKKKTKSKLILLLVCLASFFLLGGCTIRKSFDELVAENNLVAKVTYYANGGTFDSTSVTEKDLYYQEGAKALNIGVTSTKKTSVERNNYIFAGWYYAVLDDEGNPVKEGENYKLGEAVDFTISMANGDHWKIVAKWQAEVALRVQLVFEGTGEIPVAVGADEKPLNYKNGDIVQTRQYDTKDEVVNPGDGKAPFKVKGKGYTFVEYYTDAACTQLVNWPIEKVENQETDKIIYAKYIAGDWTVVRTPSNVSDMFSGFNSGAKYYLVKDIDVTGRRVNCVPDADFNCEIQGNGFAIKNLKVIKENLKASDKTVSLFGNITKDAKIENLKLENLDIQYTVATGSISAYFAFTSIEADATINNVRLSGSMRIGKSSAATVENAQLYGGYATDEEYLTASGGAGFVVNGTKDEVIQIA